MPKTVYIPHVCSSLPLEGPRLSTPPAPAVAPTCFRASNTAPAVSQPPCMFVQQNRRIQFDSSTLEIILT